MEEVISKLFQSRDIVHLKHLRETSYSKHIALDGYYKGVLKLLDRLVESSQYDSLLQIRIPQAPYVEDIVGYMEGLSNYIETVYEHFPKSFQKAIVDDIAELINSTLYKLKYLQ